MRKSLLLLAVAACWAGGSAFGAGPGGRESAQKAARALEAHYRHAKTLEAIFLESYRGGDDDLRVESGTVYFRRPGLMRWDYESPQKKLFLIDGRMAWFYVPASHTASRAAVRQSADWRTPFALLTGKANLHDLCGRVTLVPNPGGPGAPPAEHVVLDCAPKKREGFLDAQLELDQLDRIVRVVVRQPGDIETEVRFARWKENLPLPESLFQFQPPPGVAVVNQEAMVPRP